jgi:Tfp pilus assembly protein PilF
MSTFNPLDSNKASLSPQEVISKAEQLDHAGQTHEALELYRHWLKNDRTHSKYSVWFNYGWLLQKQNYPSEAEQAFNQWINSYKDHMSGSNTAVAN